MKLDPETEFSFYMRHFKENDLDIQIRIAKGGLGKKEGQGFENPQEKLQFLKSIAFLDDVYRAVKKFPERLKNEFNLLPNQLNALNKIFKNQTQEAHAYTRVLVKNLARIIKATALNNWNLTKTTEKI